MSVSCTVTKTLVLVYASESYVTKNDAELSFNSNTKLGKVAHAELSIRYDTIRYDSVCLTCSKKLTGSQLSLPHGINKKLKCKTKNKMVSMIGLVQSRYREAVQ